MKRKHSKVHWGTECYIQTNLFQRQQKEGEIGSRMQESHSSRTRGTKIEEFREPSLLMNSQVLERRMLPWSMTARICRHPLQTTRTSSFFRCNSMLHERDPVPNFLLFPLRFPNGFSSSADSVLQWPLDRQYCCWPGAPQNRRPWYAIKKRPMECVRASG